MQYQGGKSYASKQIADYINTYSADKLYFEPFCGGLSVSVLVKAKELFLSDANLPLINLYTAMQRGWVPPSVVTEETYARYKDIRDHEDPMTAFVGIGCSWGAKWFGGYARNKKNDQYAARSARSLLKKFELLRDKTVEFASMDYLLLNPSNAVIYCDPPYKALTNFKYASDFDHDEFWQTMRMWSKNNVVIISHYDAPFDFKCVKEIPTVHGIRRTNKEKSWDGKVERLWMIK